MEELVGWAAGPASGSIAVARLPAPQEEVASPESDTSGVPMPIGPLPSAAQDDKAMARTLLPFGRRLSKITRRVKESGNLVPGNMFSIQYWGGWNPGISRPLKMVRCDPAHVLCQTPTPESALRKLMRKQIGAVGEIAGAAARSSLPAGPVTRRQVALG